MLFWRKQRPSYERAMVWFKQRMRPGQAIILHTKPSEAYPQVIGYFIPTLVLWSDRSNLRGEGKHA
jgi:hypothetical protein